MIRACPCPKTCPIPHCRRERRFQQVTGFLALFTFCVLVFGCAYCPASSSECPRFPIANPYDR